MTPQLDLCPWYSSQFKCDVQRPFSAIGFRARVEVLHSDRRNTNDLRCKSSVLQSRASETYIGLWGTRHPSALDRLIDEPILTALPTSRQEKGSKIKYFQGEKQEREGVGSSLHTRSTPARFRVSKYGESQK